MKLATLRKGSHWLSGILGSVQSLHAPLRAEAILLSPRGRFDQCRRAFGVGLLLLVHQFAFAVENNGVLFHQKIPRIPELITTLVSVGGVDRVMVVDTGAAHTGFDDSLKEFLGNQLGEIKVTSASGITAPTNLYKGPILKIQELVVEQSSVIRADLQPFSRVCGQKLGGIIGMPHLTMGKVMLNYDEAFLEVHSRQWKLHASKSHSLDLDETADVPVIKTRIGKFDCLLTIDTGNHGSLILEKTVFDALVDNGWIETTPVGEKTLSFSGVSSRKRGWFLKGELMGKTLKGIPVSSVEGVGMMGLEWLFGFNTEFDFAARKCRYQVRTNAVPPLDIPMMTGAILSYDEAGAHVEKLSPGRGAAGVAGLQPGDVIEVFDTLKTGQMNSVTIAETVTAKAGKSVEISFVQKSSGQTIRTTLQLPPPISCWNFSRRQALKAK